MLLYGTFIISTIDNLLRPIISAEDKFPILRESFRCMGYRTRENIMAQRIGLREGISISNAKAVKKPVSDIRKLRKIFSLTEIYYKVWKNTPSEKFPLS